jgi:hypothetical protein
MVIDQLSNETYALTNSVNYSTNGYPTKIPTTTAPSGDGVIGFGHLGGYCPGHLLLIPIGIGAGATFSLKVLGWRATKLPPGQPATLPLWVPVELATYAITLGTATGVAGSDLGVSTLFPTTITSTGGPTFITTGAAPICPDWFQISPGSNSIGMISQSSFGFRFLEVIYTTGGSATSCNGLYAKF